MEFAFDPAKSESNREKHGIDFVEAQRLWQDQDAMVFPVSHPIEDRFILLARHRERLWAAVCTLRENGIRMISVRRARKNEERYYHDDP
jgi:uncharacterized DUF497 family protein